ncbi:hypothetical protein ABTM76_19995, partial [Acinetobacter baumannii]
RKLWWRSRPDPRLTVTALGALAVAVLIPLSLLGGWFGFERPSPTVMLAIAGITAVYLIAAQWLKGLALGRVSSPSHKTRRRA